MGEQFGRGICDSLPVCHNVLHHYGRIIVATKVNVVLDDDVKAELDRVVDPGRRSRVVNMALRRELQRLKREAANQKVEALRAGTKPVSTSEIVSLIRRDRGR